MNNQSVFWPRGKEYFYRPRLPHATERSLIQDESRKHRCCFGSLNKTGVGGYSKNETDGNHIGSHAIGIGSNWLHTFLEEQISNRWRFFILQLAAFVRRRELMNFEPAGSHQALGVVIRDASLSTVYFIFPT